MNNDQLLNQLKAIKTEFKADADWKRLAKADVSAFAQTTPVASTNWLSSLSTSPFTIGAGALGLTTIALVAVNTMNKPQQNSELNSQIQGATTELSQDTQEATSSAIATPEVISTPSPTPQVESSDSAKSKTNNGLHLGQYK